MTTINVFNPAKGNKWLYLEMVREQRTAGELDIGRNGMEYVVGVLAHLNRANGKTFVADSTIAKQAGYAGNSHAFRAVRELLVESGYLKVWGEKRRAYEVSLLVPERLHDDYEELALSTRKVEIAPRPSRIRELTRNPVPLTPDPVPGTYVPGPVTPDLVPGTPSAWPSWQCAAPSIGKAECGCDDCGPVGTLPQEDNGRHTSLAAKYGRKR
ncbi:hypothetical protein [Streptomyces sp. NPDC056670]|uniref:hypothetical protein n=1 Tax=Streptomyces sp. NPDC056670 TaxID=3345904 RepID=UPI0036BC69FC